MRSSLGVPEWLLGASARILLLALSVATLGPALHGVHDVDCEPGFVLHDESQHHVQAADTGRASALPADHCVACHFARSSRGPVSWEPSGLTPLASSILLSDSDRRLIPAPFHLPLPARAPPSPIAL